MSENNTIYENGALPVKSQFLFYQTEDGRTRIEVRLENETVWLTQKLMAELFQKDVRTINEHIQNIHEEGELSPDSTIRKFRIVQPEGTWTGARPKKADSEIAKNYLTVEELDTLNRLVTIYLDFAELQALNRKPMYMRDWIDKRETFQHPDKALPDSSPETCEANRPVTEGWFWKSACEARRHLSWRGHRPGWVPSGPRTTSSAIPPPARRKTERATERKMGRS